MSLPTAMRAVVMSGFGPPSVMSVSRQVPLPVPRPGDVLIKVAATAVNRADLMQRKGHYPPPAGASQVLGLEAAGRVVVGGGGFAVGDRVMALLSGGGYAEYAAVPAAHCMPVPAHLSLAEAAAVPEAFLTAYQVVTAHGGLGPSGDRRDVAAPRILVHAGASGVGIAASQIGRVFGATVVTTSSAGKVGGAARFAAHAVSRAPGADGVVFADKVEAAVGAAAVDLVLDPVFGGSYMQENGRVLAPDGRVVVLSFLGGPKLKDFSAAELFRKRGRLQFSTLRSQSDAYKARLVAGFAKDVLPAFLPEDAAAAAAGPYRCRPVIDTTLALEDVAAAHELIARDGAIGKCVLTIA
jgi:NADPH2:quinone reductase